MTKRHILSIALFALLIVLCCGKDAIAAENAGGSWRCPSWDQLSPIENKPPLFSYYPSWRARYMETSAALKESAPRYVLLGDSLIQRWPQEEMDALFPNRGEVVNLGINGDKTQGVIWRIQNNHAVKAEDLTYILLIGTNNVAENDPPLKIANDIATIIGLLQKENPTSKVLLLGLLPRGPNERDLRRIQVKRVNDLIQSCGALPGVGYLDLENALLEKDGALSRATSMDSLHLTKDGYRRILPHISRALAALSKE